ncbi:MAG TPA: class I SAM-dependent methyltransferase [Kofleriaceae bacterium]|nr:class I SAM-dependent methyltransferase [Kofleriaceae bacterium]
MEPRDSSLAARPFDALGLKYEQAFAHQPERREALEWLLTQLPAGARVLDIGCGTGRPTAEVLTQAGHAVTGIDVSATMIDIARRQVPGARFEQIDVRDFASEDASWDAVCAFFSLLQMPRRDLDAMLRRIAGWLVPGGCFVLATAPVDIEELSFLWMGQPLCVTSYPTERYLELLRAAGLEIVHARTSLFRPDFPDMAEEEDLFCYARRPGGSAPPSANAPT